MKRQTRMVTVAMTDPRTNPARRMLSPVFALLLCVTAPAIAQEAKENRDEVGRELGAVLAWRLMPEIVESTCREADPAGVDARKQALQAWLDKNAALIESVDERVAEIAPLALELKEGVDAAFVLRRQVGTIVKQSLFGDRKPDEIVTICKAEANPASPRWNSNGMPHIPNALAALYDWKIQHTPK
jgi:hypothetical protein